MSGFPLLRLLPPSDDAEFVRQVARVGTSLAPVAKRTYWRRRRGWLAHVLDNAGRSPNEIAADLEAFRETVREEAARQRAARAAHRGPQSAGELPAYPEKPEARQRISVAVSEGASHD